MALALLLLVMSITVSANGEIRLEIDGAPVGSDTNGSPCTILNLDGQTFASVRPILEFLDFEVHWKDVKGEDRVDAVSSGNSLPENRDVPGLFVNGQRLLLDSNNNPADVVKKDGRVFVPVRALLEHVGLDVKWKDDVIVASRPESGDSLQGTVSEILASVISKADSMLDGENKMPFSFASPVTEENVQGMLGLSSSQMSSYVSEAYVSVAAIGTFAHQVALIKCNDKAVAVTVKSAVASGFDSTKWICVFPEQSFVIDAGSYVLLVATTNLRAEKLREAFITMAGKTGSVNIFFKGK